MQTKTYFASSVPAALELARKELGEEAMLVNSKPSSPEARPYGRLEVTFAFEKGLAAKAVSPGNRTDAALAACPSSELDDIRRQISELKLAVARPDGGGDNPAALVREVTERFPATSSPELKPGESRTVALIGPPGRGKTTTLVKIAMRFGLAKRIPVKIYFAGSHSVGDDEKMARYASILGVPFQCCELLENLGLALNGDMWKGLALIDTPGISPAETKEIDEFARFFQRRPEIEKHLVLRADARPADISHVINRFSAMGISRLLFTGLDEVSSLATMAETIVRSRIPSALAGTGQAIPEDLEALSPTWLARALQRETRTETLSAPRGAHITVAA